jgi:hypothetical protein
MLFDHRRIHFMVLHCAVCCLAIQAGHVASDHSHLLAHTYHSAIESHPGVDGHRLKIGDVERTSYAAHEFPEPRPSKRTKSRRRGHVEYNTGGASMHNIYCTSVPSCHSTRGTAPTVQVRKVGPNDEFISNCTIEACIHELQIQHDFSVKVLDMINDSSSIDLSSFIRHGSWACGLQATCTFRTLHVRPPLPFADLFVGRPWWIRD